LKLLTTVSEIEAQPEFAHVCCSVIPSLIANTFTYKQELICYVMSLSVTWVWVKCR